MTRKENPAEKQKESFERLISVLREKKIKDADFYNSLELEYPTQTWNKWKKRGLPSKEIPRIAERLNLNQEWLSLGTGPKFKAIGRIEGQLDGLTGNIEAVSHPPANNVEPGPDTRGYVPLISWVQAGDWCDAVVPYEPSSVEDWLPCPVSHGPNTYALRVKGDSMTAPHPGMRSYPEGTIIYVDPSRPVTNGCRIIARQPFSNEVTFKEYREDGGKRYLKPINPQYQMQEINKDTRLCGVVIGQFIEE